jgi:hypothetical protein
MGHDNGSIALLMQLAIAADELHIVHEGLQE